LALVNTLLSPPLDNFALSVSKDPLWAGCYQRMRLKKSVLNFLGERRAYEADEITADRIIHLIGLLSGGLSSAVLIGVALRRLGPFSSWPIVVYTACLVAMLCCSAAYNFARHPARRKRLRRLDHAAIFLMIAGTYTPFTTRMHDGVWAIAMTASVWTFALAGAFIKMFYLQRLERVDLGLYLGLGWLILIAWEQFRAVVDGAGAALIIAGGLLYTVGAGFHAWRTLRFQNAIWHAFVLVAAACHYAAVLRSVTDQ
jgi:hemolysin III